MNAIPTDLPGRRPLGFADPAADDAALTARWAALDSAIWAIAELAGPEASAQAGAMARIPDRLTAATGARRIMIEDSLGDLIAVMEAGLEAIIAAHDLGAQPHGAARALWQEFLAARAGLQALAPLPLRG